MKRYDLTEDGYRRKFRASKPEVDESPEQFIVRLDRYLLRWLELSHTERSFEGLKDLIVKEQFIDSCPKELAIHLRERAPETLAQIAKIADQYLEAHGKHLFSCGSKKPQVQPKAEETKTTQSDTTTLQCYKCNARGHKAIYVASKVMKRGTVDQVDESQEAKVRMVTLCNVVKLVLAVWLSHPILTLPPRKSSRVFKMISFC